MAQETKADYSRRSMYSWAMYDWANSAFATAVMAGFFPIFYGSYWREGTAGLTSSNEFQAANACASVAMALLAPILGAVADRGGAKKKFLASFAMLGIATTIALGFLAREQWLIAIVVYGFAMLGFSGANVFYDALLVTVAPEEKSDFVSALGYSFGYLGGGVLFALNVWMVQSPETFGLPDKISAVKAAFIMVGVWWALFSIPIMLFVKEKAIGIPLPLVQAAKAGITQLIETFHHLRKLRVAMLFLLGYWLYIDGVNTVMKTATKYGQDLEISQGTLMKALLLVQFVGFPAAIAFAKIGEKIGTKRGIYIGLAVYSVVTLFASMMQTELHFYILAVAIGLVQGGVQALSRSYFSRIVPRDKVGEFFGLYNMVGKFATILGPIIMITIGTLTGSPRLPILGLILLFAGGAFLISRARETEAPA